jgi:hypothetical protein
MRCLCTAALSVCIVSSLSGQIPSQPDTSVIFEPASHGLMQPPASPSLMSSWGLDIAFSDNGFGLGGFRRWEVSDAVAWNVSLMISGAKDPTEVEYYDYWGNSYTPNKKNRLLMIPLHASVQYRLFKDDITESFRPYLTAGMGPTMMFISPYATNTVDPATGDERQDQIDFFSSLKKGTLRYTLGGFIGVGASFGMGKNTLGGISVHYLLARFPESIEVLEGRSLRDFSSIVLMLHFGSLF